MEQLRERPLRDLNVSHRAALGKILDPGGDWVRLAALIPRRTGGYRFEQGDIK